MKLQKKIDFCVLLLCKDITCKGNDYTLFWRITISVLSLLWSQLCLLQHYLYLWVGNYHYFFQLTVSDSIFFPYTVGWRSDSQEIYRSSHCIIYHVKQLYYDWGTLTCSCWSRYLLYKPFFCSSDVFEVVSIWSCLFSELAKHFWLFVVIHHIRIYSCCWNLFDCAIHSFSCKCKSTYLWCSVK